MTAAVMSTPSSEARSLRAPGRHARRIVSAVWPPVVFGVVFLGAWELAVKVFDWKPYFLTPPSAIWRAFVDNFSFIWDAAVVSGTNAFVGLVLGVLLGVAMSFLLMRFNVLNDMIGPLAVALNAIPIVVLVAVFTNQFSGTSEVPRRLMATIIVYFVVLVNVAKGLRDVQSTHVELMRSYAASPCAVLRHVRVPNAVPYLFTASRSPHRWPSSRRSSPSTSAVRRTGSACASNRTSATPRTCSAGPMCSCRASWGWGST